MPQIQPTTHSSPPMPHFPDHRIWIDIEPDGVESLALLEPLESLEPLAPMESLESLEPEAPLRPLESFEEEELDLDKEWEDGKVCMVIDSPFDMPHDASYWTIEFAKSWLDRNEDCIMWRTVEGRWVLTSRASYFDDWSETSDHLYNPTKLDTMRVLFGDVNDDDVKMAA